MQPVSFAGCFGWLHEASFGSDTAVVLCPGLGRDAATAHRSLRILADHLAANGYPALRFDYRGCGDSCDLDGLDSFDAWEQSLQAAVDWTLANSGASRLVLAGLRFGAALATLAAAARSEVAGLVLLEPVLRGRSYVAQLSVVARMRGRPAHAEGLIVDELRLSPQTLRRMAQLDLRHVALVPGCAVAVASTSPSSALSAVVQAWSDPGRAVVCQDFLGLEALLRPTHLADEPDVDATRMLSWLRAALPARPVRLLTPAVTAAPLRPGGCIETPLRFGDGRLFGVLCRPETEGCGRAVVIVNSGGDPHYGYARFSVEFARRLAGAGTPSLRMDFAGLGDSISPPDDIAGEAATHVFEVERTGDIGAGLDALTELGYDRFALHGLCSGAYHAFQAAVADPRIDRLLLVNLPWFSLRFEKAGPASFARRSMAGLAARGCGTLLLFAGGDPGLRALDQHFGQAAAARDLPPGVVVSIAETLDHDLTGPAMRQDAAERMIEFLLPGQPPRAAL